jgi:beta-lactamase class A
VTFPRGLPSRRLLLTGALSAALSVPLSACGSPGTRAPSPRTREPGLGEGAAGTDAHLSGLELKYGARLGVHAVATGNGASVAHRADERFAFCSTFKTLAAAAALHRQPPSSLARYLAKVVTYSPADVNSVSPVAKQHVATGMTISELCDAAIRFSDGTAGNLLMREIGGPAQLTAYLRGLGDPVSRMDQYEPDLNRNRPGDPRDTTTPRAIADDYRRIVLGGALSPDCRALITDWMRRNTTGAASIRAGLPPDWIVVDKTGHGDYGRADDIAVAWPPGGNPVVMAVMCDRTGYAARPPYSLIARAATYIAAVLR